MGPVTERRRFDELDAVRGLAAVTVVLYHWCLVVPAFTHDTRGDGHYAAWNAVKYTPLRIVVAGPEAVMLFFVLSGLVLALPYLAGRQRPYRAFVVRRVFRLYPAAYAAVAAAMVLVVVTGTRAVSGAAPGINDQWRQMPDAHAILGHLVLLGGGFDTAGFNAPIWSLVSEIRVSLIFPVLVALVLAARWWMPTIAAALLCIGTVTAFPPHTSAGLVFTVSVLLPFVVGIELARRREKLVARCNAMAWQGRAGLSAVAIAAITSVTLVGVGGQATMTVLGLTTVLPTAGTGVLILLALTDGWRAVLLRTVPQFLGRVSYSLYLWHVPVLMVLVKVAYGRVPLILLAAVGIGVSLAVAHLSQLYVEKPGTQLGKRLAGRIGARRRRAEAVPVTT